MGSESRGLTSTAAPAGSGATGRSGEARRARVASLLGARPVGSGSRLEQVVANSLVVAGAALILYSSAIHLHLWADHYSRYAWVGPLFLAQGVAGVPCALLLVGLRRVWLMALGAVLMVGTALGLLASHWFGLFGYRESFAVPYAGLSLVVEFVAAVALSAAALLVVGRTG